MDANPTSRKAVALLVVVFLLGLALGGFGTYFFWAGAIERGHHSKQHIVEELTRELALTPDQQKQLSQILDDTRARFEAIHEQMRPQYDAAREEGRNRIRAILTADQRPKFDAFVRRLDEHRKKKSGP
jgi:Spy/CpxP family protein refolding chaperone